MAQREVREARQGQGRGVLRHPATRVAGVLLAALILAGCQRSENKERGEQMFTAIRGYGNDLRWGEFRQAANRLLAREPEARDAQPKPLPDGLRKIRVSQYRIKEIVIDPEGNAATATAEIDYYHADKLRLRTITDTQSWWYEEEEKQWYLDGSLPEF